MVEGEVEGEVVEGEVEAPLVRGSTIRNRSSYIGSRGGTRTSTISTRGGGGGGRTW